MAPILNEVSAALEDTVQVVKIDTEKYPSIADKYRIEALPTFIIFKDGKPCDRFEGALTKDQLIQRVEKFTERQAIATPSLFVSILCSSMIYIQIMKLQSNYSHFRAHSCYLARSSKVNTIRSYYTWIPLLAITLLIPSLPSSSSFPLFNLPMFETRGRSGDRYCLG
ncbi:THIOREDOXIN Y1 CHLOROPLASTIC [Salix koriyanagi]|uniref:THIOREDOXIN Y1 CHLOROPLASTIC n=1 Tax=Salix koriyanagi TaxID=2511006 RepID=A0A9Q0QMA6_9ROSI|nr:THIOREDOXIN Y1 CHLOROPLASTIC [Salix koriyanagi]